MTAGTTTSIGPMLQKGIDITTHCCPRKCKHTIPRIEGKNVYRKTRNAMYIITSLLVFLIGENGMALGESPNNSKTKMHLKISMSKDSYSLGEDVVVEVIFKNTSSDPFYLNTAFNFLEEETRLVFSMYDEDGNIVERNKVLLGRRPLLSRKDFHLLDKGERYKAVVTLNKEYDFYRLGHYKVRATYFNSNDGSGIKLNSYWRFWEREKDVWTGDLRSNELNFAVN